jgi:hypothetical protein
VLTLPGSAQANPFWVVGAAKEVIDGHGGIWQTPFLLFIASILFQHVQASKQGALSGAAAPSKGADPLGNLASFAKSIGLINLHGLEGTPRGGECTARLGTEDLAPVLLSGDRHQARRVALERRTRLLNIRPEATTIVTFGLAIELRC